MVDRGLSRNRIRPSQSARDPQDNPTLYSIPAYSPKASLPGGGFLTSCPFVVYRGVGVVRECQIPVRSGRRLWLGPGLLKREPLLARGSLLYRPKALFAARQMPGAA